jgi:hypothetical protein
MCQQLNPCRSAGPRRPAEANLGDPGQMHGSMPLAPSLLRASTSRHSGPVKTTTHPGQRPLPRRRVARTPIHRHLLSRSPVARPAATIEGRRHVLGGLEPGAQVSIDQILMMLLSGCVLGERLGLGA